MLVIRDGNSPKKMAEAGVGLVLACVHMCMLVMCSYVFIFHIYQCLPLFVFTMLQAERLSLWVCRGKLRKSYRAQRKFKAE
jgi:hypothetical protein